MNTINVPDHVPDQMQTTPLDSSQKSHQRLLSCAKWAGLLALLYLIGPFTLLYAVGIHTSITGSAWQVAKRWARMNGVALLSLLWYLPIIVFHASLGSLWTSLFTIIAGSAHLPILIWFGGITIFPPVPSSTLLRWLLAFPLAGLLTNLLEAVQPRTIWETKRIITPEEQGVLAAAQATKEKKKIAQEQRKLKAEQKASSTSTKAATSASPQQRPRTKAVPKEKQQQSPKADSLWGNIDWKTVPDSHPLKQMIRYEAEQLEAKQQEENRNRWLTQQASLLRPTNTSPIIDSTLTSHTEPLSLPPAKSGPSPDDEDGYDWNQGEGPIQE